MTAFQKSKMTKMTLTIMTAIKNPWSEYYLTTTLRPLWM